MGDFTALALGGLEILQKRQQARAANRAAQVRAETEIARIRQQQTIRDRQKREQLRRATAIQRARFGAQGMSGGGGSAAAVLRGLGSRVDRSIADDEALIAPTIQGIRSDLAATRRQNLLKQRSYLQDKLWGELKKRLPRLSLLEP